MEGELPFRDRAQAGTALIAPLIALGPRDPLVLAVPRGGIPVARILADHLDAPLDVIVVRKVGAPSNPELAIGAVGTVGEPVVDADLVARLHIGRDYLEREIADQRAEALRRQAALRGDGPPTPRWDGDVVVVDDGIATGRTAEAAARLLRPGTGGRLLLAVPVAPRAGVERMQTVFDEVACPYTPEPYYAVGQWYEDFRQVEEDEARSLLTRG
ncbi:MAG TPA: phosphoribosyltransferase family protein [Actinomycetota bacterium]|nr:phosphoribosyltransferase family protein [Actinomycetota bacterium]